VNIFGSAAKKKFPQNLQDFSTGAQEFCTLLYCHAAHLSNGSFA